MKLKRSGFNKLISFFLLFAGLACEPAIAQIDNENLQYSDCSPTHHGLQCNHVGCTEQYEQIQKLCEQIVGLIKQVDILNGNASTYDKNINKIINNIAKKVIIDK